MQNEPKEMFGSNLPSIESVHYAGALSFLKDKKEDVVIVSKGEWANDFITYFSREYLHKEITPLSLNRGNGILIDCKTGKITEIPLGLTT